VVNFGRVFGPLAAALLMALWVAVLARLDLLGKDPGWMLLYLCGMIFTFNFGRDISMIGLFPFLFGLVLAAVVKRVRPSMRSKLTVRASGERRWRGMGPGVLRVPVAPGGAGKQD
jgi:TctA family transporter